MSNTRRLQPLNRGSGQASRPKHTWRGVRRPRSARKRRLLEQALARNSISIKLSHEKEENIA